MIVEIVIAVAVAGFVAACVGGYVFLRRLRNRAQHDLEELVGADNVLLVDRSANCGGHDDPDTVQLRGAGVLALTTDALRFMVWMPRGRHLDVPLTAITATAETRTYRRDGYAKASLRPMLHVEFRTKTGAEASAVWTVTDAESWCEAIDEQRAQH